MQHVRQCTCGHNVLTLETIIGGVARQGEAAAEPAPFGILAREPPAPRS